MTSLCASLFSMTMLAAFATALHGQAPESPPVSGAPIEIVVGGRTLIIPLPQGYVRCDGVNAQWDKAILAMLPASNRMFASFGTAEDQASIEAGTPTDFSRNFNVQVVRSIENKEIGERSFGQVRNEIKQGLEEFSKNIQKELDKVTAAGNKKFSAEFGADAAFSVSNTVFLGFFEESDISLGFTMAMKVGDTSAPTTDQPRMVAAALMAPVNGRLLSLYSTAPYSGESDRQQAEKSVAAWRDAIVAANPRVAGPNMGFDWTQVGRSTIIGGAIGAIFGLFAWLIRKSKRKKSAAS